MLYCDPSAALTEKGVAQARAVALWIPKEKPDELLCSPAQRVRSTAEILSNESGLPMQVVQGLNEADPGQWEGKTYLEVKKTEPEQYHRWCADPIHNAPPGGESIVQLSQRVVRDVGAIVKQHHGQRVILVTHAGVIRSALVSALGMPIENFWRLSTPTGSITKIDYTEDFATVHYLSLRV